jgi:hypothetical protein
VVHLQRVSGDEVDMNGMTCEALSCKNNHVNRLGEKDGWCDLDMSDISIDRLCKCKSFLKDMDYLHKQWEYQKGREFVHSNRSEVTPEMMRELKE